MEPLTPPSVHIPINQIVWQVEDRLNDLFTRADLPDKWVFSEGSFEWQHSLGSAKNAYDVSLELDACLETLRGTGASLGERAAGSTDYVFERGISNESFLRISAVDLIAEAADGSQSANEVLLRDIERHLFELADIINACRAKTERVELSSTRKFINGEEVDEFSVSAEVGPVTISLEESPFPGEPGKRMVTLKAHYGAPDAEAPKISDITIIQGKR